MSDTAYSNVEIFKETEIYISTHTGVGNINTNSGTSVSRKKEFSI
jgi:hypothetical protein